MKRFAIEITVIPIDIGRARTDLSVLPAVNLSIRLSVDRVTDRLSYILSRGFDRRAIYQVLCKNIYTDETFISHLDRGIVHARTSTCI